MAARKSKLKGQKSKALRASAASAVKIEGAAQDGIARTQGQLARAVHRSPAAVVKWLRRADWPFSRKPPWDVSKVHEWMSHLSPANVPRPETTVVTDAMSKARLIAAHQKSRLMKLQSDLLEGKVHDVAECKMRRLQQIQAVKGELLDMGRSMAPLLEGLSREQIQAKIDESVDHILRRFAGEEHAADSKAAS